MGAVLPKQIYCAINLSYELTLSVSILEIHSFKKLECKFCHSRPIFLSFSQLENICFWQNSFEFAKIPGQTIHYGQRRQGAIEECLLRARYRQAELHSSIQDELRAEKSSSDLGVSVGDRLSFCNHLSRGKEGSLVRTPVPTRLVLMYLFNS